MPEQRIDVKEQIDKIGDKWNEFQKSWISHFKDIDFEVLEWNFGSGWQGVCLMTESL